jgi:hypothetical protein
MDCDAARGLMLDVVYGEEVPPSLAAGFFLHVKQCGDCSDEYLELLETREMLQDWPVPQDEPVRVELPLPKRSASWAGWWPMVQRMAATVLMVAGALYLAQMAGLVPEWRSGPGDEELQRMIHEVVVARQDESLRVIGEALLSIKEELELRDRARIESVYSDLYTMEQRWLETLESRNQLTSARPGR